MLKPALVACGNFFFKYRDFLNPLVFIVLAAVTRPAFPLGDPRDTALLSTGLALMLAGQLVRASVIGLAYIKRGGKDKEVYADRLVQEGIFAHCRNPLYVGNLLLVFGLLTAYGSPLALAIGGTFYLFMYVTITLAEEHYLASKFGEEYERYCSRVNRYLPSLRGLAATMRSMTFDWRRVIRKDYGTAYSWTFCVIAMLAWKSYLRWGRIPTSMAAALVALWFLAGAAYVTARLAKKRGQLGTG